MFYIREKKINAKQGNKKIFFTFAGEQHILGFTKCRCYECDE